MKIYRNFKELKEGPPNIYEYFKDLEEGAENKLTEHSFMEWYGGDVHVIEYIDELREIKNYGMFSEKHPDEWSNLLEAPCTYEICKYLPTNDYVNIYICTSDSGGPTYFIPKDIADKSLNVLESIKLSHGEGE